MRIFQYKIPLPLTATLCLLLIVYIGLASTSVNALENDKKGNDILCKKQILHLNGEVDRIQWFSIGYGDFSGFVVYSDGKTEKITGSFRGFCDLESEHKSSSSHWLTTEEREKEYPLDKVPAGQKFDDTYGNSAPGLEYDVANFFGYLTNRTTDYNHNVMGRGYHLTRLLTSTNIAGHIRWIDQPSGKVFLSRKISSFRIPCDQKKCPWGLPVIEGDVEKGARIAIYGYYERRLNLLAHTPWHGDKTGWINFVGIRDFDNDKHLEIAAIRDPQNEGILEIWELQNKKSPSGTPFTLIKRDQLAGFSNHLFGTKSTRISTILPLGSSGLPQLIVPNKARDALRIISAKDDQLKEISTIALPLSIAHDMALISSYSEKQVLNKLIVPLSDNTIRLIEATELNYIVKH